MSSDTLFTRIINKELPSDMLYQDDLVTAFRDINPAMPTHILIVPNRAIPTVNEIEASDEPALGRMLSVAARLAREAGVAESGYRLIINCGENGRQEVMHIHMHLVGGGDCGPMLVRRD